MEFTHVSVMRDESINGLNIKLNGTYVDGTLGGGGHSKAICEKLSAEGTLIGIDRDEFAIKYAGDVLADSICHVALVHNNFSNIQIILDELNIDKIDGMILDLGVSSFQLDEGARGFSYMQDAPLDMRMDKAQRVSAFDVVNNYSEKQLNDIIFNYGEERWAKRIAQFIVARRADKPFETTFELVDVIKGAIPKKAREGGPHPAKRTFQAIRIEVNNELSILEQAINDITDRLTPGGRLCIITFHSLEDRIVKNAFRILEDPCTCPKDFPICVCGKVPQAKVITRRPIVSTELELDDNHRARSAKLRVLEKR